jgi:thioredoxin 1
LSDKVVQLTSESFEREVLRASEPVLVDFWATWCPPCRMIAPAVEALADDFAGRAKVAKVDVDSSPELAERFGIQSIPTLLVFKGGQVVDQRIGAVPKSELFRMLEAQTTLTAATPASGADPVPG